MIVIDSSALVKYVAREDGWEGVERYLVSARVVTLDLALKEVANALWKKILKEEVSIDVAIRILSSIYKVVRVVDEGGYLEDSLRIAVDNGLTVYDSLFIALALRNNAELLTSDKRQSEVAGRLGVKVILV